MTISRAMNIAGDMTGFYPESLKLQAKKFIAQKGTAEDKKILQKKPQSNVQRLNTTKVQRIGEYNEENSHINNLSNLF